MTLSKFGFIVTGAGLEPKKSRATLSSPAFSMIAVGVSHPEQGIDVAREMVGSGVQLIELCGGFGPVWTGRIIDAIDRAVPVGAVAYGAESLEQLHDLFKP
jgi:hypothetical protein